MRRGVPIGFALLSVAAASAAAGIGGWRAAAPLPEARSEVAAAVVGGRIAIVGGFRGDGSSSPRVDLYDPADDTWRSLPDLPYDVNHAAAASDGKRLFVAGGYAEDRRRLRRVFVLGPKSWLSLRAMPEARAAAGAAVVGQRLYVVGGLAPIGLARTMLVLDLGTGRWARLPGPTPREHLAVVAARGAVYAIGGRTAGFDTNLSIVEMYDPRARRWRRLPPVPEPRGGTAAAAIGGRIVSIGGEAGEGTIASVYAYRIASGRWERLPDLPTPRHGLGVAAVGTRVYAIAGGDFPGLTVTTANEVLELG